MTVNRGPGVAKNGSVGVTTVEHRLQLAGQYAENAPGVPRSGVLAQATSVLVSARPDMSYDIGPFQAVISRTASEGVYTPTLTGTTNVPTDDAPATNSRWDLIYVKQNDVAKGDADNLAVVGVVKGTAAASPTKPTGSLPAGALVLAEARIFALTTATNGGSNTVAQVWRHTAARGGLVPVRTESELNEFAAPALGQRVMRLDQAGKPVYTWDGTAWRLGGPFAQYANQAVLNSTVPVNGQLGPFLQEFPAGRFTVPPIVTFGVSNARLSPAWNEVTKDGFKLYIRNDTSVEAVSGAIISFTAMQMTSTAAAG